jgi:hypothetical protein
VSSKEYAKVWKEERVINPHLFKTKILRVYETAKEAHQNELKLQKFFNVHKNPMFINKAIGLMCDHTHRLESGTHHFQNSEVQSKINKKRLANGTHYFGDSEKQREFSAKAKSVEGFHEKQSAVCSKTNAKLIAEGKHNLQGEEASKRVKALIEQKKNRPNVLLLKEIQSIQGFKLGQNWWRKSDEWINEQINHHNRCIHVH